MEELPKHVFILEKQSSVFSLEKKIKKSVGFLGNFSVFVTGSH